MKNFIKSIYAGISIGLGGVIFLNCQNKTLGAFLFSIGLIGVLAFGFNLYTGKVCYAEFLKNPHILISIWIGNFIGAILLGLLISQHNVVYETARTLVDTKLNKSPITILIDGFICGVSIAFAVKGFNNKDAPDILRCLMVVLGVMVFILCGAEHVVADMFYFAAARDLSVVPLEFLIITTFGNTLGGVLFSFV